MCLVGVPASSPSAERSSRTLPAKLPLCPAVTLETPNYTSDAPDTRPAHPGGASVERPAQPAPGTQRVCLAPGQDRSGPEHTFPGAGDAAVATAGDRDSAERAMAEERLFDDSADDVLMMLMDSLPEPVTETGVEAGTEPGARTKVTKTRTEPEMKSETETETETERRTETRPSLESERKPLSVIVVTTVIDSANGETSPSQQHQPQHEQQQERQEDTQWCSAEERTLKKLPDLNSAPLGDPVCGADISSDTVPER